ncbi:MAG: cation:dicarboxylase symporter family transporter [Candidatus Dependentiae bacterium]
MLRTLRLPLQLVGAIILVTFFGSYFSPAAVRFFFTVSHIFKEFLGLLLPFIIFSFIASGILSLKRGAPLILLILLACIFVSNFIITTLSYVFVRLALPVAQCPAAAEALAVESSLDPLINFKIPQLVSPALMLVLGVICGIVFSIKRVAFVEDTIEKIKSLVEIILLRIFIPLLPIYVFGYLLEINHRGILTLLFRHYGNAIVLILCMQMFFIFSFFVLARCSFKKGWESLKIALPSYITAVSTISSTATIPVTVECAEKNTGNRPLAEMSVPLLANIHLMGAGINIPILSLATLILFKAIVPDPLTYLTFVFYFCTSMFAVTGIPGAGLIVMMPLLDSYFHFSPIMISVLTTLYLLMDASSAGTNVMGDGALIIIVNKLLKKLKLA